MNVEYQCPICHSRGFFEANRPIYKCHIHTDTIMEQVEFFNGPNFTFKDEGDKDPNKTGILTMGADPQNIAIVRNTPTTTTMSDEAKLVHLRDMYERVTGHPADRRWGIERLTKEVESFEYDQGVKLEPHEEETIDTTAEEVNV